MNDLPNAASEAETNDVMMCDPSAQNCKPTQHSKMVAAFV
jgi:hypothetical protein